MAEGGAPAPSRLQGAARRRVVLFVAAIVLAILLLGYWLRSIIGPVLLALALAYVLDPMVRRLNAMRLGRPMAVFLVFVLFMAIGGLAIWFLLDQGTEFYYAAFGREAPDHPLHEPGFLFGLGDRVANFLELQFPSFFEDEERAKLLVDIRERLSPESIKETMKGTVNFLESIGEGVLTLVNVLSILVLVPIYLFYFMLDWPGIVRWIKGHLPGRYRRRVVETVQRIHTGLAAFLRGRIVIAVIKGLLTAGGLQLTGIPYAFLIGMLSGLLSILPFVGAALGVLVSAVLVLVDQNGDIGMLVGIAAVFGIAEAIEGYLLYPWILSEKIDMHPVTMLVSVLVWGAVLGFFGVLVAIPLTIVVKQLVIEFVMPPIQQLADEAEDEDTPSAAAPEGSSGD
jgi:predicted PurR-regulated permease PerM